MNGRHGQARVEEKMKRQKEGDPPITRAEVWIETHTRKDGFVPSGVTTHMERLKDLLPHDILNDPLTQVFGVDKRGRVRGVGNVSGTQIVGSSPALEMLALNERKVTDQSTSIKKLESQMKNLIEEVGGLRRLIIKKPMDPESQGSTSVPPKMPGSIAVSNPIENDQSSMKWQSCKLLSRHNEVVAQGRAYMGKETQQIHGKSLLKNAYKVMVDIVDKGDIGLFQPDGYHSTLGEIGN